MKQVLSLARSAASCGSLISSRRSLASSACDVAVQKSAAATTKLEATTTSTSTTPAIRSLSTSPAAHSNETSRRELPQDGLTLTHFVAGKTVDSSCSSSSGSSINSPIASLPPKPFSFSIKTYGCQMNVSDSDVVRAVLLQAGYPEAKHEDEADIWLTNTCAIRDNAERKVWQRLRGLRKQKQEKLRKAKSVQRQQRTDQVKNGIMTSATNSNPASKQVVGLLGCMAERLQDELFKENLADLVVGPDAYRDLPRLLGDLLVDPAAAQNGDTNDDDEHNLSDPIHQAINVQLSQEETYEDIMPIRDPTTLTSGSAGSAFVSIQRGCSNRCSFCIVPFTRGGQERSRPYSSIMDEVQHLVDQNVKEVVLLGQNVNSYHDRSEAALLIKPQTPSPAVSNDGFRSRVRRTHHIGGYHFADLVAAVSDVSPELRVRFTSPHPKDYPNELLHLMAERPNVCNQLHMPAQSGSTDMLKRMKRGYSREAYLELIDAVQSIIPDVALSSDFIAGFCGETDQDHRDTVSLLERVQYDQAFLFAYSMREKTHAHRTMQDDVPEHIKKVRLQEIIDTFRTKVHEKNERVEVGKLRLVLVEGEAKRKSAEGLTNWHGRTDQNKRVMFPIDTDCSQYTPSTASAIDGEWIRSRLLSGSLSQQQSVGFENKTALVPGDYAVVHVTEAKGHTLRGKLLWKTTLAKFDELESNILSKVDQEHRDSMLASLEFLTDDIQPDQEQQPSTA